MTYAKLPSGAVVDLDGVILARRMRPEELPEGAQSGYLLFRGNGGSPLAFSVHPEDVEALDRFYTDVSTVELSKEGATKR